MALMVGRSSRTIPTISGAEVLPGTRRQHRPFGVDEEHWLAIARTLSRFEALVRVLATAAGHDPRHSACQARLLKELTEAFAAGNLQLLRVAAAFYVESDAHQRVPPISPRVHRSPRRYLSSQGLTWSASSRRSWVAPAGFSQTMMDSGVSLRASTSTSECVVTTSWVRALASTKRAASCS